MKFKLLTIKHPSAYLFLLLLCLSNLYAQNDTEFWFAAPEITKNGAQNFDRPIYLRMSTLGQAATVTISLPANPTFIPIVVNIPANGTNSLDLTPYINILENTPANTVLRYGLYISASTRISAYYEVSSATCNCNPEIFALKGRDALGTEFYTPFQNLWNNSNGFNPIPYSAFDIVATEDNTTITIETTNFIVGHAPAAPFTITLNRGQTYSARALSTNAARHLGGSHITSDKPIAVTIKDDLLRIETCADVMGDQIVPVEIVGTEYIVMRGFMNPGLEHAFILATQDNTTVSANGTVIATINAGESYTYQVNDPAVFIETSAPAYVLHASGFGCEVGGALLPSINCTGSNQIGFTRSTTESMGINIMVKAGAEGDFLLNGSALLVPAAAFTPVPATNGVWMSAQLTFTPAQVAVGAVSILSNASDLFHMGVINGGNVTGSRFGYFSGFNTLNLGPDQIICRGDTVILDGDDDKDSYLWNDGSSMQTLAAIDSGTYTLIATRGTCTLYDTLEVGFYPPTGADFPSEDTTLCEGNTLLLDATTPNATYIWQDNSGNTTYDANLAGQYWVEVTDEFGCTESDTLQLRYETAPQLSVNNDTTLCPGDGTNLMALVANDSTTTSYLWNPTGDTSSSISVAPAASSSYTVAATNFCGTTVSLPINVNINPPLDMTAEVIDASCAAADNGSIAITPVGGAGGYLYSWSPNAGTTANVSSLAPNTYSLTLSDAIGCQKDSSFVITEPEELVSSIREQVNVDCFGNKSGYVSVAARGGTPEYVYALDGGNFTTDFNFDGLVARTYQITVQDAQNCESVLQVDIVEPPRLEATTSQTDASCYGLADGSALAMVTGGVMPYEVIWIDHPNGPQNGLSIDDLPVGTYQVLIQDSNACETMASASISQPSEVVLNVTDQADAYCNEANGYAEVDALGGTGVGYTYEWNSKPAQFGNRATDLDEASYEVIVSDADGCQDTLLVSIGSIPVPIADFMTNPSPEKPILESRARIQFSNQSQYAIEYNWDMGDGTLISDVAEPFYEYSEPGIYTIVLTAFDSTYSCPAFDSIRIEIIPDGKVFAPTAFTPNSDGINDEFRMFGEGIVSFQCFIYDRWGRQIAILNDLSESWDGRDKNGRAVQEGVYIYMLKVVYNSGIAREQGGSITVLR